MTADLTLAADPGFLERSADPAEFVIQACERAKTWLREALEHGDISQIVEVKSQAEAIRVYTMQKQLGKDAQLSAAEVVRRAERGIGVAIRRGQESGEIQRRGATAFQGNQYATGELADNENTTPRPVTDFASYHELAGNGSGIYDMTDDVSDAEFEEAVSKAKAEGNLARANVVRKIKARTPAAADPATWVPAPDDRGSAAVARRRELIRDYAARGYSSRQMEEALGTQGGTIRQIAREMGIGIPADALIGKTRIHDSNRIVRETVHALEGLAMGVQLIEPGDLDLDQVQDWTASLTQSVRALNRLIKTMRKAVQ